MAVPIKVLQEKHGAESPTDIYPQTSVDAVKGLKEYVLDLIYPVGSIYITTVVTDPSVTLGGTWEKYAEGRTIIGANATYPAGSTGGEAKHTLSTAEMPSHGHGFSGSCSQTGSNVDGEANADGATGFMNDYGSFSGPFRRGSNKEYRCQGTKENRAYALGFTLDWRHTHTISGTISEAGLGEAHNNMQPYIATYIWKRTA